MKIGIEIQRLFRKQRFGIETSALQLITRLKQLNPKTDFVVYARDEKDQSCLEETDHLKIKTLSGKLFFDFEQFYLPLATKSDKIDILHCTGNTRPIFSPVPVVQTLHDVIFMDPISFNDSFYQQFGNRYRRYLVPLVTPKSDIVITVSEYEKERILQRIKIKENKIKVIYNGIDENRFKIINDTAVERKTRIKYRLPERFILFIGNQAFRKNARRVLEAYCIYASQVENPLPMVTPGLSSEYISDQLTTLRQQDKYKSFITTGYVEDEDLAAMYNLATLLVYPSLSEGFGMPLVEAMACGTPVITSNISCLPEIAGNAALLVDPLNANHIANAIQRMVADESYRLDKVWKGLDNAKRFSWTKTAEEVFSIYERVHFNSKKVKEFSGKVAYDISNT